MKQYQWTDGSGYIVLNLNINFANMGYHMGQCDSDIAKLRQLPEIAEQLSRISVSKAQLVLSEYGAWDIAELSDHDANLSRILWIACGDICDNPESYE